jgi:hypothetical protein
MRTPNFRSAAYSDNFKTTPVVAPAPGPAAVPPAPSGMECSGTRSVLQRARKIPDYSSAYLGNFQMLTNINNKNLETAITPARATATATATVGVESSGTTDL